MPTIFEKDLKHLGFWVYFILSDAEKRQVIGFHYFHNFHGHHRWSVGGIIILKFPSFPEFILPVTSVIFPTKN